VLGPDHTPRRALFKDIGEEVAMVRDLPLPEGIERVRHVVDAETAALSIQTDVMDGVLRHLAAILDAASVLDAEAFWDETRRCLEVLAPGDAGRRGDTGGDARGDDGEVHRPTWEALFAPRFRHSCLNRLQLRNTKQMVDLTDQAGSLQFAGTLANPLTARSGDTVDKTTGPGARGEAVPSRQHDPTPVG